ncbi:MAG TPA: MscL family protein [Candidatus Saccharimonadales bacterium]|nr:MscL family protein [Candidatus Saccharimonadales bacterium]
MSGGEKETAVTHVVVATQGGVKLVPAKHHHGSPNLLLEPDDLLREQASGFANFLREYAVVGLAIGFVVGQQANMAIKQLVDSFISPWLQLIFGTDFNERATFTIHRGSERIPVAWGAFVYAFIEFVFVAISIYLVVKLLRLDRLKKDKSKK